MPTYSYACTACEHSFDTVQTFTDSSLTECPECTGRLRKLYSNVGIVFKGSGFYRNDSRAGGPGDRSESSESGSDSKSESGSTSESGAKSESKAESGSKSESGSTADSTSESGAKSGSRAESKSESGSTSESGSSGSGTSSRSNGSTAA